MNSPRHLACPCKMVIFLLMSKKNQVLWSQVNTGPPWFTVREVNNGKLLGGRVWCLFIDSHSGVL